MFKNYYPTQANTYSLKGKESYRMLTPIWQNHPPALSKLRGRWKGMRDGSGHSQVKNMGFKPKSPLLCADTGFPRCRSGADYAAIELMIIFLPESSKFRDCRAVTMHVIQQPSSPGAVFEAHVALQWKTAQIRLGADPLTITNGTNYFMGRTVITFFVYLYFVALEAS